MRSNFLMTKILPAKVMVPLVLGIVLSLAIMIYAELGYRRLETANRQMALALQMQATLNETLTLVIDAETGQRGYLLTGNVEYLDPYKASIPKIREHFHDLRELLAANGTASQRDRAGEFNNLVGKKLAEIEATLALNDTEGRDAAMQLVSTGLGKRTMDEIRTLTDTMARDQRHQLEEASTRWRDDIEFARVGMQVMTAFTVALLLVVLMLARREIRTREEKRLMMAEEQRRLASVVEQRTAELSELSNYLQIVREEEKAKLARDIHDELGGILVSAKMDVAWVAEKLHGHDPLINAKLDRAMASLDDGVDMKRRIIEELRPTLLDNLGLSAAIEWQVREVCDRAALKCEIVVPVDDSALPPQISIALFRVVQESLTNVLKYARARKVTVELGLSREAVTLVVTDDGIGLSEAAPQNRLSHGILGMQHRVRALGGDFSISGRPGDGTTIEVHIPLPPIAEKTAEAETAPA
jgi:signal transduction histidine kinase